MYANLRYFRIWSTGHFFKRWNPQWYFSKITPLFVQNNWKMIRNRVFFNCDVSQNWPMIFSEISTATKLLTKYFKFSKSNLKLRKVAKSRKQISLLKNETYLSNSFRFEATNQCWDLNYSSGRMLRCTDLAIRIMWAKVIARHLWCH